MERLGRKARNSKIKRLLFDNIETGDTFTSKELGDRLGIKPISVAGVMNELCNGGYASKYCRGKKPVQWTFLKVPPKYISYLKAKQEEDN